MEKCCKIDANNTQTLRYLQEVEEMIIPDEPVKGNAKQKNKEVVRYQSDNEIIIQPLNVKEPKGSGLGTLFNVAIGLVLGVASMYFLILPSAVEAERERGQAEVRMLGEQLDSKNTSITSLEDQIESLMEDRNSLRAQLEAYVGEDGTLQIIDNLLEAASQYLTTLDAEATANYLDEIAMDVNILETSQAFQLLYNTLLAKIGPELSQKYYTAGYTAYMAYDYPQAIEDLLLSVRYDETNGDALLYLGNAYRMNGQNEDAIEVYEQVIALFPGSDRATRAQGYINQLTP